MEIVETINGEEIHGVLRIETPNFDDLQFVTNIITDN
jgi:hypothetical protein